MKIRARKDEDKLQRRGAILDAGDALFAERSFSDLTMADVADRAGIAKGTVYLYFPTKEALFLDLLETRMIAWIDDVDARLLSKRGEWSIDRVVRVLTESLTDRETLIRMLITQATVLEHNISLDRARQFKLALLRRVALTAKHLAMRLPFLSVATATRIIIHIHSLVVGIGQMAFPADVTCQVLDEPELRVFKIDLKKEFSFALRAMLRGLERSES